MKSKYQTLSDFILSPFNVGKDLSKDLKYDAMYRNFIKDHAIYLQSTCIIEDSYYYHIIVPSESQKGTDNYDVVIRFFSDRPEVLRESHLRNYYIQFFSNSPSFIYQYSYLYNKEGYLIAELYNKMDSKYINEPPSRTNPDNKISYDKSIYFACRYLSSERFAYLGKFAGAQAKRKKDSTAFFKEIKDVQSIRVESEIRQEERLLTKELTKAKVKKQQRNSNKKKGIEKISATSSNSKKGSSFKIIPKNGGRIKISASRSTKKH